MGNLLDHKIQHDYPTNYIQNDAFQHQQRAESIKEMGNYRNEIPYLVSGFTNVIGFYGPQIYHVSVLLSLSTGFELYDTIQLTVFALALLSTLIMFLIINQFNQKIALLSLQIGRAHV